MVVRARKKSQHLLLMHEHITRIRLVEERLARLIKQGGRYTGDLLPSAGQEAAVVGALVHLNAGDWVSPTPRELGAHLVRGMPVRDLLAHFASVEDSPMRGRDGGGRLGSAELHTTPSIGSTASNFAVAAGVALAMQLKHRPNVAVSFFGDGVMNTGTWHEAINFAAVMKSPLVMVCNNNGWAYATPTAQSSPTPTLGERAEAYGIPWQTVDGTDAEAVYLAAGEAVAHARAGKGPFLVEVKTVRLAGYSVHEPLDDVQERYKATAKTDVLLRLRARLDELDLLDGRGIGELERGIAEELDAAVKVVEESPAPSGSALSGGVYANTTTQGNGKTEPVRKAGERAVHARGDD